MHCPDNKTLSAYGAGELNAREWSYVDKHFVSCADCQKRIEAYRAVHDCLSHSLGRQAEADALVARILKQLESE